MADSWPTCGQGCAGALVPGEPSCLAHLGDDERNLALERFSETGELDVRGVAISGALLREILDAAPQDTDGHRVFSVAQFDRATFSDIAEFGKTTFKSEASFHEAMFKDRVDFSWAMFEGDARFDGATFAHWSALRATFNGDADFDRATFRSGAWFTKNTFNRGARFAAATFEGDAHFDEVTFKYQAYFNRTRFKGKAAFGQTTFSVGDFGHTADFGGATFNGDADFEEATFKRAAWFAVATFNGTAGFDGATFEGDTGFAEATFNGIARLYKATFKRRADFHGAAFNGDARVDTTSFGGYTDFNGAMFEGEAWFPGVTFKGYAGFGGTAFQALARFDGATFEGDAEFRGTIFKGWAQFGRAAFTGTAAFARAVFKEWAQFDGATFEGDSRFDGAGFGGAAGFVRVAFEGYAGFSWAMFVNDARFSEATFKGETPVLGPVVVGGLLDLDGTQFASPVRIEADASALTCRRARFSGGVRFGVRRALVWLDDSDLSVESMLTGVSFQRVTTGGISSGNIGLPGLDPWDYHELDKFLLDTGTVSHSAGVSEQPKLISLREVNVAGLVLGDVDLANCRFAGAHNLDKLQLEAGTVFGLSPAVAGWERRQVIAEETAWRAARARPGRWIAPQWYEPKGQPESLSPGGIAGLYRALRKSREDAKDEPGAADFYYGEMEMRRRDKGKGHANVGWSRGLVSRGVLTAYWLLSGYGLRAWRSLTALAIVVAGLAGAFRYWGFTHPTTYWKSVLFAFRSTISLTDPHVNLTAWGELLEAVLRLTGPVLLALTLLALRRHVKR